MLFSQLRNILSNPKRKNPGINSVEYHRGFLFFGGPFSILLHGGAESSTVGYPCNLYLANQGYLTRAYLLELFAGR